MPRILRLILIVFATIALTYGLVLYVGVRGFLFAWTLNMMLMMCVFLFTETLKSGFLSTYYYEKTWEVKGKVYENLGINYFRKLLVLLGWEKFNKKSNPVNNSTEALLHLHYRTMQSELGHIIILFIVLGFSMYVAFKFGIVASLWLLTLNILMNLYPIFLQRYNRPRLNRAITLRRYRERQNVPL